LSKFIRLLLEFDKEKGRYINICLLSYYSKLNLTLKQEIEFDMDKPL